MVDVETGYHDFWHIYLVPYALKINCLTGYVDNFDMVFIQKKKTSNN